MLQQIPLNHSKIPLNHSKILWNHSKSIGWILQPRWETRLHRESLPKNGLSSRCSGWCPQLPYGKSPLLMGKSTISMVIFQFAMLVYQAGYVSWFINPMNSILEYLPWTIVKWLISQLNAIWRGPHPVVNMSHSGNFYSFNHRKTYYIYIYILWIWINVPPFNGNFRNLKLEVPIPYIRSIFQA